MEILISGASGLVGSALEARLSTAGHRVRRLVREGRGARPGDVAWNPEAGSLEEPALAGVDAVVHLAGAGIASRRWTARRRVLLRQSRLRGTRIVCEALARMSRPPACLVCASAVGYYGNRGDEPLAEESPPGSGFLAELCVEWEGAAAAAGQGGIRVVHVRTGMALSPAGGALPPLLRAFRLGLGGRIGNGKQFWSWITLADLVSVYEFALSQSAVCGALNAVTPVAARNLEFTRALARVLGRPALLPVPGRALRLLLGEMADELLLSSARAVPARLTLAGFRFESPDLEDALRRVLGR